MIHSLDLFSGYGGISYGLREYIKPIGYCEIDNYARAILSSRISEGELPFAPIYSDVTKLRGSAGAADIITGGFPCQDISSAGLGKGLAGERSGLFFEIIRLTKEISPAFVFLENVPAIRTRGLLEVVRAFTEIGYDCRWTCISAASLGAPHKRERWFLLAYANSERLRNGSERSPKGKAKANSKSEYDGKKEYLAYSNGERFESDVRSGSQKELSKPGNNFCRDWWATEPNVGRVVDGVAFRVDRIKSLGNGVVPIQVKTAFEKLMGVK